MRPGRRVIGAAVVTLVAVALGWGEPIAAQIPDSIVARADSAAAFADSASARSRVLRRLGNLNKPLGVDSSLIIDRAALARARGSRGSGGLPVLTPADSLMRRLLELSGYTATDYEGRRAEYHAPDQVLILLGEEDDPAQVVQSEQTISAIDSIIMDDRTGFIRTRGETVTQQRGGEPVISENIIFDINAARGTAIAANTQFSSQALWYLRGDMPGVYPDSVFGEEVDFTTDEEWRFHFAAREAKIVGGGWLVARNVTLNFDDVPVMWLPFLLQNVEGDRSSGILFPQFSLTDVVRTSRGQSRRVSNFGYYWATNDYSDLAVTGDWWSDNFFSLTGVGRYNIARQFLRGTVNFRRFWRSEGGRELTFNTNHNWQMNERTSFTMSASYASSTDFVRRNSFDPREVTQSIDSQGGFSHRFDWGSLSLSANRRQFLNDDRVEQTLPTLGLSLSSMTLFRAPEGQSSFYNNLTWSGSSSFSRSTVDRPDQAELGFQRGLSDRIATNASFSSSLNAGGLSWSQSLRVADAVEVDIPLSVVDSLLNAPGSGIEDLATTDLNWNTGFRYQQRLVGTTTLTPTLSFSGQARRSDDIPEASSFVSGPMRTSFGAILKSDIYGFFGGFGSYDRIRHKLTPSIDYRYAPSVTPTDLQVAVFGAGEQKARNVITLGINQTFEAKRSINAQAAAPDPGVFDSIAADSTALQAPPLDPTAPAPRTAAEEIINLLSLRTQAVTYDFVRGGDGRFIDGFQTTSIRNSITSDLLRGLSVDVTHNLFGEDDAGDRTWDPLLTSMNLSFSMNNRTNILGFLPFIGGDKAPEEFEDEEFRDELDDVSPNDPSMIVPGQGNLDRDAQRENELRQRRRSGSTGQWNLSLSYSLNRVRDQETPASQMLRSTLRFKATENWDVNWRTSFDVANGDFLDHSIRLTRDLGRWEARFDFLQTATGNWSFRFNVALIDLRDLKFEYDQRSENAGNRF